MKVSVCMATRNGEKYISTQLGSILRQLLPDDEVIISDDSSTDGTVEILSAFSDPRIKLFKDNTFYNPRSNFENALRHSSGDILILSDQDDIWLDNKVAVVRELFQRSGSPVHLVVLDAHLIDASGAVVEESIFRKINAGKGVLKNIYDNTYLGCCMAFSRPLLEIALPFPQRIPMHDMWLGILAELFGTVEFVEVKTMHYRRHPASMTEFRLQFKPVTQIKRRLFLCFHLALRYLARKLSRQDGQPLKTDGTDPTCPR